MKKLSIVFAVTLIAMTAIGQTQQRPQPPATYENMVASVWKALHNKILEMAKDFPEEKLDWRPHPDSRSMVEEFRHVTTGLKMSAAELRGERFDYMGEWKADSIKPKTRESIVSDMEAAIAASYPLVETSPKPRLVFWIDHQGEHYGKLVSNYRMNNIVPPMSRPRPR